MGKIILGVVLGGVLGVFDGLTALVSAGHDPEIRDGIVGIVIGSTMKGLLGGLLIGWFAKRVRSVPLGLLFGVAVGAALATLVALGVGKYFLEIILPGSIVGLIVGFATQTYSAKPATGTGQH